MIGVDEVGRGCWAGPLLVVAARQIHDLPQGLMDSKLLSAARRRQLVNDLSQCCEFGEGWVSAEEIDQMGLSEALSLAGQRALSELKCGREEEIILDGVHNYLSDEYNVKIIIKADQSIGVVSAASVWAKVKRDAFMAELEVAYPNFLFSKHVGYGTALHTKELNSSGPIKGVHRFCFKPIKGLLS